MLLHVDIPHEPFNSLVRAGTWGRHAHQDPRQPQAGGGVPHGAGRTPRRRLLIEIANPSDVPRFAEPFFLKFNADCRFRIVMSPEELGKAGLGELGKRVAAESPKA